MTIFLRFVHILSGIFWAGGSFFATRFIMPSLKAAGPAAGPVLAELGKRKVPVIMMVTALVNVGSGIWLMMIDASGDMGTWMRSGFGRTLGLGAVLAILALLLGVLVGMPSNRKMGAITAAAQARGGPPNAAEAAELERLQARSSVVAMIATVLLFLAASAMAVARYVN